MALINDVPYKRNVYTVKQYGEHTVRITYSKAMRESGWEEGYEFEKEHVKKGSVNSEKLACNLARAKTMVREYALCNPWDWWCTFTIDPKKYDRKNLDAYFKDFSKFLQNYNRCEKQYQVKYLLVPEQHKDGAWHIHGFIKGIKPQDIFVNEHSYLSWKQYHKKFGFISMEKLKDQERASSYILKYMTKDTDKNVSSLHKHLYYCSKGLDKATELFRGSAEYFGDWDWEQPEGYVKIKTLDVRKDNISDYMEIIDYDDTESI